MVGWPQVRAGGAGPIMGHLVGLARRSLPCDPGGHRWQLQARCPLSAGAEAAQEVTLLGGPLMPGQVPGLPHCSHLRAGGAGLHMS